MPKSTYTDEQVKAFVLMVMGGTPTDQAWQKAGFRSEGLQPWQMREKSRRMLNSNRAQAIQAKLENEKDEDVREATSKEWLVRQTRDLIAALKDEGGKTSAAQANVTATLFKFLADLGGLMVKKSETTHLTVDVSKMNDEELDKALAAIPRSQREEIDRWIAKQRDDAGDGSEAKSPVHAAQSDAESAEAIRALREAEALPRSRKH